MPRSTLAHFGPPAIPRLVFIVHPQRTLPEESRHV